MIAASEPGRLQRTADHPDEVRPERPRRPVAMELAAATVILAGCFRLVAILLALAGPPGEAQVPPFLALGEVLLQLLAIATGLLVRFGRAWVLDVNVLAVLTFLELIRVPSPLAVVFTILFGLTFAATFMHKPWFDALAGWRALRQHRRAARV